MPVVLVVVTMMTVMTVLVITVQTSTSAITVLCGAMVQGGNFIIVTNSHQIFLEVFQLII